jgi:hypothetical protein
MHIYSRQLIISSHCQKIKTVDDTLMKYSNSVYIGGAPLVAHCCNHLKPWKEGGADGGEQNPRGAEAES